MHDHISATTNMECVTGTITPQLPAVHRPAWSHQGDAYQVTFICIYSKHNRNIIGAEAHTSKHGTGCCHFENPYSSSWYQEISCHTLKATAHSLYAIAGLYPSVRSWISLPLPHSHPITLIRCIIATSAALSQTVNIKDYIHWSFFHRSFVKWAWHNVDLVSV